MSDIFCEIAEMRIREAIINGELNDLPGQGEPLELENPNPFESPEDRIYFKIMKNLGLLPIEVSWLKEIESIKQKLKECRNAMEREHLKERLRETTMKYNIKMEARKKRVFGFSG